MRDLISRQEAIDAIKGWGLIDGLSECQAVEILEDEEKVPSTQPERKMGKWKGYNADNPKWLRDDGSPVFLECSACNTIVMNNGSAYWNFCPNCGADMKGEQE